MSLICWLQKEGKVWFYWTKVHQESLFQITYTAWQLEKWKKSSKGESIKEIQSRTEGCEQWVPYIGLEERPPIRTEKGVFGPGTKLYEDFKEEDSIDQRPYLLITTIESFVKNNFLEGDFTPKEVKLFVPFELADRAFGYGTKVELRGVTEEEIEKYEFARKYSEDGQAVCRQTFARITGTYGERTQSHTNFTKICKGAKIRTSITKGMKDTSSHFDPNKVYHISFSGQRFQELFGSLDRLVETCGSGGGGSPTILNNIPMRATSRILNREKT